MKYILLGLMILLSSQSYAAVYEQIDKNGQTTYSDEPMPNSQRLNVEEQSAPPARQPSSPAIVEGNSVAEGASTITQENVLTSGIDYIKPYTDFIIKSPTDQQTFQNQRNIVVDLGLSPGLKKNDTVQVFVDGVPYGAPVPTLHPEVNNMERGTHTLFVVLLDKNGTVLKRTNSVTIFIHYAHIPTSPPVNN